MPSQPPIVIAIDGPAGAGKSTVAKQLAKVLKISYLDTGAMYRALTLKGLQEKINFENENSVVDLAKRTNIELEDSGSQLKVLLDGKDVSDAIRSVEVTNSTFYVARAPKVREIMVQWQRRMAQKKGIVAEGRDIGTVVFPHATKKFYLDANVEERSRRRIEELKAKGKLVDAQKLTQELQERDQKDFTRSVGPLKQAEDAVYMDTTFWSVDENVSQILKYIQKYG